MHAADALQQAGRLPDRLALALQEDALSAGRVSKSDLQLNGRPISPHNKWHNGYPHRTNARGRSWAPANVTAGNPTSFDENFAFKPNLVVEFFHSLRDHTLEMS